MTTAKPNPDPAAELREAHAILVRTLKPVVPTELRFDAMDRWIEAAQHLPALLARLERAERMLEQGTEAYVSDEVRLLKIEGRGWRVRIRGEDVRALPDAGHLYRLWPSAAACLDWLASPEGQAAVRRAGEGETR